MELSGRIRTRRAVAGFAWLLACGVSCQREPLVAGSSDVAAPVTAQALVDRAVASTGDRLEFRIEVEHDPGYEIQLDEIASDIDGFRLLDLGSATESARGRTLRRDTYLLRADLVGSYILPPVKVRYRPRDDAGEWQEIETARIFVEIESVVARDEEASDVRDIKPIREIGTPFPWYGWLAVAVALAGVSLAAYRWWRHRRPSDESAPPVPAHVVALEALRRLRQEEIDDAEAVRLLHFALSEVVRAYVEGRFALNATDLTTEEILDLAPSIELSTDDLDRLVSVLKDSDRVKFARHEPGREDITSILERSVHFVESTVPAVVDDEGTVEKETAA